MITHWALALIAKRNIRRRKNGYEVLYVLCGDECAVFLYLLHLCMITAFWRFSFYSARIDAIRAMRYNFIDIHKKMHNYA